MASQGRHGQWLFAERCTDPSILAEAVVNPSSDDQHGWDHILEITPPQKMSLPADLRTPVITSFVQIKTTRGKKIETTVKLSNAVKAAKSPLPSFVFLFHYEKTGKPVLYGKHIWKEEIAHYLKRARKAGNAPLHKKTVTVKFAASDRLSCNPVDWVLAVLSNSGGTSYALEKGKFEQTVGYEMMTHVGHFSVGPLSSQADFVLHELGIIKDLPVSEFKIFDNRFGIQASTPFQEFTDGRVIITKEGRPVLVRLRSCNGDELELPGLAWAPSIFPSDHPEFKIRVKAGHIDIIASPSSIDDGLNTQLDIQFGLQDNHPFIEQLGLLALINWTSLGPVTASVEIEQGQLFGATITLKDSLEEWAQESWVCARYFLDILGSERCKDVRNSLQGFNIFMRDYFTLATLHDSNFIRFEGLLENELATIEKLVGYSYGQFGEWTFGLIHELTLVSQTQDSEKFTLQLAKPNIVRKFVFSRSLIQTIEHIQHEFKSYISSQDEIVVTFNEGDLSEWGKTYESNGTVAINVHEPSADQKPSTTG